jgi:hypothetical protein
MRNSVVLTTFMNVPPTCERQDSCITPAISRRAFNLIAVKVPLMKAGAIRSGSMSC